MMDTKIEIGQENIYFEMESKQEDNAVTYDSVVFRRTLHRQNQTWKHSRIKILIQ